jgi:hypothetical protein
MLGEVVPPPPPKALIDALEWVLTEHRMDDETRTCTCGEWKWEAGPARPSELHRIHVAAMIARKVVRWVR